MRRTRLIAGELAEAVEPAVIPATPHAGHTVLADADPPAAWPAFLAKQPAYVQRCWARLVERVPALPIPAAGPTEEGFQFCWSQAACVVQIDALPDGRVEWFARERPDGAGEGSEDPVGDLPSEAWAWLARTVPPQTLTREQRAAVRAAVCRGDEGEA